LPELRGLLVPKERWAVSATNSDREGEPIVRSRPSLKSIAGAVALAVVGGFGFTLAWDEPTMPKDELAISTNSCFKWVYLRVRMPRN
jgi:hypothetical protein